MPEARWDARCAPSVDCPVRPRQDGRGRFLNPPGSPVRAVGLTRDWMAFFWHLWKGRSARVPVPGGHVLPEDEALRALHALAGRESVTWLGHAAFLLRLGGMAVLTDPWLSDWAGPRPGWGARRIVPPGLAVDRLPPIDCLVLSHNHYDHLCTSTLKALPGKDRIRVVVPLGLGDLLRRLGFRHVWEMGWGDRLDLGPLAVRMLPAIHHSGRRLFDHSRTLWASYRLESGARAIWFGGDTAYGPLFRELGAAYGAPDLALVGIGAYEPRVLMHAVHTDPEEAVATARDLGAKRVLGMHWGTVILTTEEPFEAPARFRAAARAAGYAEENVWLLRIGETRAL